MAQYFVQWLGDNDATVSRDHMKSSWAYIQDDGWNSESNLSNTCEKVNIISVRHNLHKVSLSRFIFIRYD